MAHNYNSNSLHIHTHMCTHALMCTCMHARNLTWILKEEEVAPGALCSAEEHTGLGSGSQPAHSLCSAFLPYRHEGCLLFTCPAAVPLALVPFPCRWQLLLYCPCLWICLSWVSPMHATYIQCPPRWLLSPSIMFLRFILAIA